jgi:hypothetical protein
MSELASIRGGQNLEFVLWLLKKRQAAEDMATFYANQNAEGPRREGGLSNQQWQGFRCTIARDVRKRREERLIPPPLFAERYR